MTVQYSDLDWDLRAALRRERLRLSILAVGFIAGALLILTGWVVGGALLVMAMGLSFISRILVGMLRPPEAHGTTAD